MIKIIGLKAYQKGYTGCAEYGGRYEFFSFSRRSYKPIQEYPVAAFENRRHFICAMGKFIRTDFFLKNPLEVESVTLESLDRCHAAINKGTGKRMKIQPHTPGRTDIAVPGSKSYSHRHPAHA